MRPIVEMSVIDPDYKPPHIGRNQQGEPIALFGGRDWHLCIRSWADVNRLVHAALEFRAAWEQAEGMPSDHEAEAS